MFKIDITHKKYKLKFQLKIDRELILIIVEN